MLAIFIRVLEKAVACSKALAFGIQGRMGNIPISKCLSEVVYSSGLHCTKGRAVGGVKCIIHCKYHGGNKFIQFWVNNEGMALIAYTKSTHITMMAHPQL